MLKRALRKINFSIGTQISLLLATVFLAFLTFAIYNYGVIRNISNRYQEETNQYSEILNLKNNFQKCDRLFVEYIHSKNRVALAEFNDNYELILKRIECLNQSMMDEEAFYLVKSIHNSFESYYIECSNVAYLYNTQNDEYFEKMSLSNSIIHYLDLYVDDLLKYTLKLRLETKQQMDEKQFVSISWNAVIVILAFLTIMGVTFYIRNVMTNPINKLSKQAHEIAAGNLEVQDNQIRLSNEVGFLANIFNDMADSIRKRIQAENEKMETEKRLLLEQKRNIEYRELLNEARFIALQTQTNPHFLFNTLNSISRTITLGREEQAIDMLDSLSELLRYNLADGRIPVSLDQEVNITKKYLNIQKLRFADRIEAMIRVDQSLLKSVLVPRFILQPLVENAIIHGLEPKVDGGKIILDAKKTEKVIKIRVFDNGVGISRDKLIQIRNGFCKKKSKQIGIWNTCKRIQYFTGDKKSFKIVSRIGVGTMIVIHIPINCCGKGEENNV